ncbi:MAG: hypothetical protein KC466_02990 [Myxococcales bacterium]|nr:hypothetical protein [Myxococcales bacterium]
MGVRAAGGRRLEARAEVPLGGAGRPPKERREAAETKFVRQAVLAGVAETSSALEGIRRLDHAGPEAVRALCRSLAIPSEKG